MAAPRRGDGGASTVSSTQTLSPGGEPQLGIGRFSSPMMAVFVVAHEGTHPIHMPPPPIVAEMILEEKGFSRGRCPVSRFPWMENCSKLTRSSTHNGNSPDSRLLSRRSVLRLARLASSDGIGPLSMLLWMRSVLRLARLPSSGGISPVRLLPLRRRSVKGRLPSSDGISPVRLLSLRNSPSRLARLPSSDGISPVRLLPERSIVETR